ncbi:DNA polymerase III subunit epsilon [Rhizomicrobium electricum]|jgi:DNA polymerase-3 subunit epsilon|uniref:DNA polymerase III subunit epsilon n=1 Tax=Rhizomicrobium electricum TaxID=480070 RepID=A0ABN1F2H2_9PROT|nr:DNA polymerase III subunit epsilon [Rhizomicrobium electricum]NIJ49218.1 DNA polymerase-3 subunit epsilon [Rhizomicrobium electricum]
MREIVLDTETTGLDPASGDRLVEIGCVELVDHFPTGAEYHVYINPERDMPEEAEKVHGLSASFLADKPVFADIAAEFLEFIGDAPLVIHNAAFDMKFLNFELSRAGHPILPDARAIDTLAMARIKFPGSRVSLDELCKRFAIDATSRTKHGALIDSDLLAQVYLELLGGRQKRFILAPADVTAAMAEEARTVRLRPEPLPSLITPEEREAHAAFVKKELGEAAIWNAASAPTN